MWISLYYNTERDRGRGDRNEIKIGSQQQTIFRSKFFFLFCTRIPGNLCEGIWVSWCEPHNIKPDNIPLFRANIQSNKEAFENVLPTLIDWLKGPVWPVKSRQISIKSDPTLISLEKWKILTTLTICQKMWRFGQNNCCHRLRKVAQRLINRPILSHWKGQTNKKQPTSMYSYVFRFFSFWNRFNLSRGGDAAFGNV